MEVLLQMMVMQGQTVELTEILEMLATSVLEVRVVEILLEKVNWGVQEEMAKLG